MDNEEFEDNESQDDEGGNWDNDDVMDGKTRFRFLQWSSMD